MTDNTTIHPIDLQAAKWFTLLQSGEATEQQLLDYLDWIRESELHEQAYASLETNWDLMNDLELDPSFQNTIHRHSAEPVRGKNHSRIWLPALAASVLIFFGVIFYSDYWTTEQEPQIFLTALGNQSSHTLDDGTVVTLNTASEIHVTFDDRERIVYLERGEALFDVAPSADRPFTVVTEAGSTRALGTAFNIELMGQRAEVTLIEGKVMVNSSDQNGGNQKAILNPGDQVIYDKATGLGEVIRVNTELITLWQQGKLNFEDTPLTEVVAELNRYSRKKLVIGDPSISGKRISARISIENIDSFLRATEILFGIKSEIHYGKVVLTQAKSDRSNQQ